MLSPYLRRKGVIGRDEAASTLREKPISQISGSRDRPSELSRIRDKLIIASHCQTSARALRRWTHIPLDGTVKKPLRIVHRAGTTLCRASQSVRNRQKSITTDTMRCHHSPR